MSNEPSESDDTDGSGVLSPEELEITESDRVAELEDGRFVISPENGPPIDEFNDEENGFSFKQREQSQTTITEADIIEWLNQSMQNHDALYGFHVAGKFDRRTRHHQLYSNDVTTAFEHLVTWFAQNAGGETPVETVLGILLMESNVPVKYPSQTIKALVESLGVHPSDSVKDLLVAASEANEIRFPPESE